MESTHLADTEDDFQPITRPTLLSRVVSRIAFGLGALGLFAAMAAAIVAKEVPGKPMLGLLLVAAPVLWALACILWFGPFHRRELVTDFEPEAVAEVEAPAEVVVPAQPAGYDEHGQIVPIELDVDSAALDLTAAGSGPVGFSPDDLESLARLDVDAIELTGSLSSIGKDDR